MREVKEELDETMSEAGPSTSMSEAGPSIHSAGADVMNQEMLMQIQQLTAQVNLLSQQNMELNQGQQTMAQFMHTMMMNPGGEMENFQNLEQTPFPDYVEVHCMTEPEN